MTETTTAPPQAWHRLHHAATDVRDEASRVLREKLPGYEWPADMSVALGEAFRVAFDIAFQAGRDSRGPIADADRLWAVHVQGSDDIMAYENRYAAERFVAWADARDAETSQEEERHKASHPGCLGHDFPGVYLRASVVEWHLTPADHAEGLREQNEASS